MSRRKQRGPLLKGALDVLELPVPDLEAGGQQRKGGIQVFHRLHAITEQHACRTVEHRASTFWCVSVSAGFHHTCESAIWPATCASVLVWRLDRTCRHA